MKTIQSYLLIGFGSIVFIIVVVVGSYYAGSYTKDEWWRNHIAKSPRETVTTTVYVPVQPDSGKSKTIYIKARWEDKSKIDSLLDIINIMDQKLRDSTKDAVISNLTETKRLEFGNDEVGHAEVNVYPMPFTDWEYNWTITPPPRRIDSVNVETLVEIPRRWYESPYFLVPIGIVIGAGVATAARGN